MSFKIEERFEVKAPIAEVWAYLIDPGRVVKCLPGAELTEVIDERTYAGRVRVKVGPVTAAYKGTARLEEATEAEHLMRLTGEGKETGGSGTARMAMIGRLAAGDDGGTQVAMEAEIDVAGKMAQFGRGLMEDVTRQLFRQFAGNMQAALAQPVAGNGMSSVVDPSPGGDKEKKPSFSAGSASSISDGAHPVGVFGLLLRAIGARLKRLLGR